jgi:hypothetical protein
MFIKEELERIVECAEKGGLKCSTKDVIIELKLLITSIENQCSFIAVYQEKDDFGVYEVKTDWAWSPGKNDDVMTYEAVLKTARDKLVSDYVGEVRYQEHIQKCKNTHHDEREPQVCDMKLFVSYQSVLVDDKIKEEARRLYELEINEKKRKELEEKEREEGQKRHWINKLKAEGYAVEKK